MSEKTAYLAIDHNFIPHPTSPNSISSVYLSASQYYSLKQLVTLLEHADAPMGTYIAACTRNNIKWVASIEKADVLAYLRGQTDDAAQVCCGALWCSMGRHVVVALVVKRGGLSRGRWADR